MRRITRWVALTLACTMVLSTGMTAKAAEISQLFHAKFYAQTNSDLAALYGNDEAALYQHFITTGLQEGRVGSVMFDVNEYKRQYPDLVMAFGNNNIEYYRHYLENGMKEGRSSGGLVDPVVYADTYPDIKAACGYHVGALAEHFMTTGLAEGRTEVILFNADCYGAVNPDLAKQYKENAKALFEQYLTEGMAQSRQGARAGRQFLYICEKNGHIVKDWKMITKTNCTEPSVQKGFCVICSSEETNISIPDKGIHIDKDANDQCDYCGIKLNVF